MKHICPFNSILPKISIPKLCPIRWRKNDEIEILPMLYPCVGVSYPMFILYRIFFNKGRYLQKREFDLLVGLNFAIRLIKLMYYTHSVYAIFQYRKHFWYQVLPKSTEELFTCPNIGVLFLNFSGIPRCSCLHTFLKSSFSC